MRDMVLLQVIVAFAFVLVTGWGQAAQQDRPNVILIISDDHGFGDYGFMGHDSVQTPHLDRMANASLLYPRGYVMPVCSPSLACLLTGVMPRQHGITGNDLSGQRPRRGARDLLAERLLSNPTLLPKALSDSGYLTFQTGKLWNVTYDAVGFTHGMTKTAGRHGDAGLTIGRDGMGPVFDFIDEATAQDKPFFIWHAPFMPHAPHTPPERLLERYRGKGPTRAAEKYYAMVEWFDETCGELDEHLDERGLRENTAVIYLADNGWDANHGKPIARAKLSPYENGIRTPVFVRWPRRIKPRREPTSPAHIVDIVPTILSITGTGVPAYLPGINLLDAEAVRRREAVFVEAYNHDIAELDSPAKSLIARVVIEGWWKLVIPGPARPDRSFATVPTGLTLFNLETDPLEKTNLADTRRDIVGRLLARQQAEWDLGAAAKDHE